MEIKRTTEIVVETERRFVVHQTEHTEQIVCPVCAELMLTAEQAAGVFDISHRAVFQLVERGMVHFAETQAGVLFVCPSSVAAVCSVKKEIAGEVL